jgi:predicted RNA binding protein YcfA (HicA-like mRNA interferase family)
MKIRDVIKLIKEDGWYKVSQKGSHRQYKHPVKQGRVTIAGHPGDDLGPDTFTSVFTQAQLPKPKKK